jgi:hypothetical protein
MTMQFSVAVRNARLDAIEDTVGVSPVLEIRSGAQPANCAATATGTLLASITLPSDWAAAAASGAKAKSGTWSDASADATGTAGHWRLKASGGTCHAQGSCGLSAADMILNDVDLVASQVFTVTSWVITDGNA